MRADGLSDIVPPQRCIEEDGYGPDAAGRKARCQMAPLAPRTELEFELLFVGVRSRERFLFGSR